MISWEEVENSYTYQQANQADRDKIRTHWDQDYGQQIEIEKQKALKTRSFKSSSNDSDFTTGVQRGLQNLQASTYGAGALVGSGLKKMGLETIGQGLQDIGMEGYRRNIEEAGQFAKKHSFKDIYTGETGIGGAIDWAQGTLGELVPSMAEAAIGAAIGTAVAPGAGTAAGGLAGRTVLRKSIDGLVKQAVKKGIGNQTEAEVRKQITKQALKKLGGKVGMGAAVMPMESGSMYAGLLEEHGVDAPETALLFGALATSLEFAGGNSKLVDTFVDALGSKSGKAIKESGKELLHGIPKNTWQEAAQEGAQGAFEILNTVVNTDEEFFTQENFEDILENMAAGAVGGAAGGTLQAGISPQVTDQRPDRTPQEIELDTRAENILSQDAEQIDKSIQLLNNQIKKNQAIINDYRLLEKEAAEKNIVPDVLIERLHNDIRNDKTLIEKVNSGTKAKEEFSQQEYEQLSPEEKEVYDTKKKLDDQRATDEEQFNQHIKTLDNQITKLRFQYTRETDKVKKKELGQQILNTIKEQNQLLGLEETTSQEEEIIPEQTREERQADLEEVFGTAGTTPPIGIEKDAQASATIIGEEFAPKAISDYADEIINIRQELERQSKNVQGTLTEEQIQDIDDYRNYINNLIERHGNNLEELTPRQRRILTDYHNSMKDLFSQQTVIEETLPTEQEQNNIQQIATYNNEIRAILNDNFSPEQHTLIEDYWQGVKQELAATQEEMTPGTEAFLKKRFFETKLAEIEENVNQDTEARTAPEQKPTPSLAEQNKRQAWFQQVAKELGDFDTTPGQTAEAETPRHLPGGKPSPFKDEQQGENEIIDGFPAIDHVLFERAKLTGEPEEMSIRQFLDIASDQNQSEEIGAIAKLLNKVMHEDKTGTKVVIDPNVPFSQYAHSSNTIYLRPGASIKEGMHEVVHALTARDLVENKVFRKKVGSIANQVSKAAIAQGLFTQEQFNQLRQYKSSEEFNQAYKNGDLDGFSNPYVAYAFLNEREFLAQAMNSPSFQQLLKETSVNRKQSAWDVFVNAVMKLLGFDKNMSKTAFSEVLATTAHIARTSHIPEAELITDAALTIPEQRITNSQYQRSFENRTSWIKKLAQLGRMRMSDIKLLADKSMGSISTRLRNVDPSISQELRKLDFNTSQKIVEALKAAQPLLEAAQGKPNKFGVRQGGMTPQDRHTWDLARKNGDTVKIEELANKYGIMDQVNEFRNVMNQIRREAKDVGYDVGFLDEYWPRIIKDQEGFLQKFYDDKDMRERPVFTEAFREQAKKLGITQEEFEEKYPDVKADIISNIILGRHTGIGGPGNIQERVFDTIPEQFEEFYMDSDAALMQYIYSMTKKIEARKFFGKVPERIQKAKTQVKTKQAQLSKLEQMIDIQIAEGRPEAEANQVRIKNLKNDIKLHKEVIENYKFDRNYTENIGTYISDLMIEGKLHKRDEKMVRDILDARFHERGTGGVVSAYKNLAYIDTMGSPVSAATQIGDLAWAMYVGKVWTPKGLSNTVKNLNRAILNKSGVTKEDLGIERIAQEFADGTTLSNAVSWVFKNVGLEKMDSIGKEVLINNARDQYKAQAQTAEGREKLLEELKPTFGRESNQVINDLLADNPTSNVKMLLYSKLLDFQPVALSEMPEFYLKGGDMRVLYMLKTYTLKQFDVFRREVFQKIKSKEPDQIKEGVTNAIKLMTLLTFANASADEIKDWMLGKDTDFSDHVIENFLTMGGASRYMQMQVNREGLGSALSQQILPPFKFVDAVSRDAFSDVADGYRSIESIPIGGKLYYWHYGRGSGLKKTQEEKDFSKAGKPIRKFKKQFENADDPRLFAQSNLAEFKQMKLYNNFQSALSRNQAVINKLEKLEQTANVRKRLGQLENQRKQLIDRYFLAAEGLS